jgi:hypothetical protein
VSVPLPQDRAPPLRAFLERSSNRRSKPPGVLMFLVKL